MNKEMISQLGASISNQFGGAFREHFEFFI
jgi:hypothetical protein